MKKKEYEKMLKLQAHQNIKVAPPEKRKPLPDETPTKKEAPLKEKVPRSL